MLDTLIVDDEPPARKRLRKLLQPLVDDERLRVIGEAGDGEEALNQLGEHSADLIFLDIQMPEMSGFDVLDRLTPETRPAIIFVTAYDEYALRAFEANAVDYLLKPIARERLEKAVARVERALRSGRPTLSTERLEKLLDWIDTQEEAERPNIPYAGQLTVSYRDRIRVIPVEQVVSIEINEGITRLFVLEEENDGYTALRQHVVDYTLDHLEDNLDPVAFMRVHRSAIVHLRYIQELIPWFSGRYKLVLAGGHEVIASRERSKRLKDRFII